MSKISEKKKKSEKKTKKRKKNEQLKKEKSKFYNSATRKTLEVEEEK